MTPSNLLVQFPCVRFSRFRYCNRVPRSCHAASLLLTAVGQELRIRSTPIQSNHVCARASFRAHTQSRYLRMAVTICRAPCLLLPSAPVIRHSAQFRSASSTLLGTRVTGVTSSTTVSARRGFFKMSSAKAAASTIDGKTLHDYTVQVCSHDWTDGVAPAFIISIVAHIHIILEWSLLSLRFVFPRHCVVPMRINLSIAPSSVVYQHPVIF